MVAGDEVGGGDGGQRRADPPGVGGGLRRVLVHEIPGDQDQVRLRSRHRREEALIVPAELRPVEVRELHDPQPRKPLRQPRRGEGEVLRLDAPVFPQGEEDQRRQQERPDLPFSPVPCHAVLPFR